MNRSRAERAGPAAGPACRWLSGPGKTHSVSDNVLHAVVNGLIRPGANGEFARRGAACIEPVPRQAPRLGGRQESGDRRW